MSILYNITVQCTLRSKHDLLDLSARLVYHIKDGSSCYFFSNSFCAIILQPSGGVLGIIRKDHQARTLRYAFKSLRFDFENIGPPPPV